MTKHYKHLTQEERYQIAAYLKAGFSEQEIAESLHRYISIIKRELKTLQAFGVIDQCKPIGWLKIVIRVSPKQSK